MHAFLKGSSGVKPTPRPSGRSTSWERLFSESAPSSGTQSQQRQQPATKAPASASALSSTKTAAKPSKKRPLEQLYLDFGQRTFGRTVECAQCGFTYCEGEPSDEADHKAHHRWAMQGVVLRGALGARAHVLHEREGGERVVALHATDGADAVRKVGEAKQLLDAELGTTPPLPDSWRAYLFVEARTSRIRGVAITEPLTSAFHVVPPERVHADGGEAADGDDECGPGGALHHDGKACAAMAGISHVWVDRTCRRQGIARELLDAARHHFATGFAVPRDRLAFSQTTSAGRRLAASYAGTEAFLVYE